MANGIYSYRASKWELKIERNENNESLSPAYTDTHASNNMEQFEEQRQQHQQNRNRGTGTHAHAQTKYISKLVIIFRSVLLYCFFYIPSRSIVLLLDKMKTCGEKEKTHMFGMFTEEKSQLK